MKRLSRLWVTVLMVLPLAGLSSLSQQNINITVSQSLFLDCTASPEIDFSVTKTEIEGPQPFNIGPWSCNVDALTKYRLNATLTTLLTNIVNADQTDFSQTCTSATGGNPGENAPACAVTTALSGDDPATRRGTGGNTAGTPGAVFSGNVRLDMRDWDVRGLPPPGGYTGVITYTVTDTTP